MSEEDKDTELQNSPDETKESRRQFISKAAVAAGGLATAGLILSTGSEAEAAAWRAANPASPNPQVLSHSNVAFRWIEIDGERAAEVTITSSELSRILSDEGLRPDELKNKPFILKLGIPM